MADPAAATDPARLTELAREQSELEEIVALYRAYQAAETELAGAQLMAGTERDPEMAEMAAGRGRRGWNPNRRRGWRGCNASCCPKTRNDDKNVIVEIRAGTGGDEAGLFAADLFRMYPRWADEHGFKTDLLSHHETGIGGFKEVIFQVKGRGAYSRLKYESGVHRVQRVPATEAQGRIHTSTATVAVLARSRRGGGGDRPERRAD